MFSIDLKLGEIYKNL